MATKAPKTPRKIRIFYGFKTLRMLLTSVFLENLEAWWLKGLILVRIQLSTTHFAMYSINIVPFGTAFGADLS